MSVAFVIGVVGYPIAIKLGKNRKTHLFGGCFYRKTHLNKKSVICSYYINLCLFSDIDALFGNGGSLCGGSSCRGVG